MEGQRPPMDGQAIDIETVIPNKRETNQMWREARTWLRHTSDRVPNFHIQIEGTERSLIWKFHIVAN